jgi:putative transposase
MASVRRNFVEGGIYHIYNRGNHRSRIFFENEDSIFYLMRLHEYCRRDRVEVLAYCLMSNHYHLLLKQGAVDSITKVMRSLGVSYAKYFNWQYEQVGHLYQGRYGARYIYDNADLANVARYIHQNPSSMGDIVLHRWSDLGGHLKSTTYLLNLLGWSSEEYESFVYEKIIREKQPTSEVGEAIE